MTSWRVASTTRLRGFCLAPPTFWPHTVAMRSTSTHSLRFCFASFCRAGPSIATYQTRHVHLTHGCHSSALHRRRPSHLSPSTRPLLTLYHLSAPSYLSQPSSGFSATQNSRQPHTLSTRLSTSFSLIGLVIVHPHQDYQQLSSTPQPMRRTPNHALQRTAPCVTAPASTAALPPAMQVPRRTPRSLSLGSLGD